MSTGPKTAEGRKAIADATRQRMASGQREKTLQGFYGWLETGGREFLSRKAKTRAGRTRHFPDHIALARVLGSLG